MDQSDEWKEPLRVISAWGFFFILADQAGRRNCGEHYLIKLPKAAQIV
jgi:hypothetical protein